MFLSLSLIQGICLFCNFIMKFFITISILLALIILGVSCQSKKQCRAKVRAECLGKKAQCERDQKITGMFCGEKYNFCLMKRLKC